MRVEPSLYFDTSYLVRLYLEDVGFEQVRQLAAGTPKLASAWHAQAEVISALHRAFREGRYSRDSLRAVLDQFEQERTGPGFLWLPLNEAVHTRLAQAYRAAPATNYLRAADALHLACAASHGHREVFSSDRHFLAAAPLFELKGRNPLG